MAAARGQNLRELAFADLQAGRHASAARALDEALALAAADGDPARMARILAIRGMNEADQGRHDVAIRLLAGSAQAAAGSRQQEAWSTGVLARSLLLAGQLERAAEAAARSTGICHQDRWNAFLPWPQALRVHCLAAGGRWEEAWHEAEHAFALASQLGDPCWEGMAGRALALVALHAGDSAQATEWIADAGRRCNRVPDRYVWVSGYVAFGQLEIAAGQQPDLVLPLARAMAAQVANRLLQARAAAVGELHGPGPVDSPVTGETRIAAMRPRRKGEPIA